MNNTWHYIRKSEGTIRPWNVEHWIYSAAEFKIMLADVGFSETKAYKNLDGSPYDNDAWYLVVVGIK